MKKVSILALHLGFGGIEKCITSLANMLVNNYDVEILCVYKLYDKIPYELDNRIKINYLTNVVPNRSEFSSAVKSKNIIKIIKEGINSIKVLYTKKNSVINAVKSCNSDIIISTRDYFNYIVGKYATSKQLKIAWEHNHHNNDNKYIKNLVNSCRKMDKLVLVSNSLKEDYETIFKNEYIDCKCVFISNFLDEIPSSISNLNNNNLVTVGRLEEVKGYSDLIDIIKLVNSDYKVTLDIIGDGSQKEMLQDKINKLNMNDIIKIHGYQDKTYINNIYLNSSLYLMTSYSESFGLVLIEAMSYGLPCIAFNSASGATDIIKDEYNGYLISGRDIHEYTNKVVDILSNRELLTKMGNNARNTSLNYDKNIIIDRWIKLLEGNL